MSKSRGPRAARSLDSCGRVSPSTSSGTKTASMSERVLDVRMKSVNGKKEALEQFWGINKLGRGEKRIFKDQCKL